MSSKTPPAPVKKTASAPKSFSWWVQVVLLSLLVITALVALGLMATNHAQTQCIQVPDRSSLDEPDDATKRISGPHTECLQLERVSTPQALAQGLSGRQSIEDDQGMLFTFEEPAEHCFWMKDMNFAIDIIWLDAGKRVVDIEPNAKPESYPKQFCPSQPAKYVIEVNDGVASQAYISVGSQLQF